MSKSITVVALEPVAAALASLGVEFYIGGSIASSVHGVMRTTLDVDIIANLLPQHVPGLVSRLEDRYYADDQMIRDAIRQRSSFNLIHLETAYKIDVFIMRRTPFEDSTRRRAVPANIPGSENLTLPVVTAEDIILNKLEWYRAGGEMSERQWLDVLGVLRVQREALDREYLRSWAVELKVADLLERALREAAS